MTARAKRLVFEVLHGCTFVPVRPQHVKRGDVFRVRTKDGEPHLAVGSILKDFAGADDGIYIAAENGDEHGVPIRVYPETMRLTVSAGPPE